MIALMLAANAALSLGVATEMIYTVTIAVAATFAISIILGSIVATLLLKGYNYAAALAVVTYLLCGLGTVIYALA